MRQALLRPRWPLVAAACVAGTSQCVITMLDDQRFFVAVNNSLIQPASWLTGVLTINATSLAFFKDENLKRRFVEAGCLDSLLLLSNNPVVGQPTLAIFRPTTSVVFLLRSAAGRDALLAKGPDVWEPILRGALEKAADGQFSLDLAAFAELLGSPAAYRAVLQREERLLQLLAAAQSGAVRQAVHAMSSISKHTPEALFEPAVLSFLSGHALSPKVTRPRELRSV